MAEPASSSSPASSTTTNDPKLCIRTYRPTDREYVDYLFYSTYFALVPEGVKRKLMSPTTWIIWIAVYAYLLAIVPVLLHGMNMPSWTGIALRIFFTVSWALVGFSALFFLTDRFETVDQVETVRLNDLSDPEIYYLNYNKYEQIKRVTFDKDTKPATELVRELLPEDERTPGHFWVLEVDGAPCGIVGLACYKKPVMDARPIMGPSWQRLGRWVCERYHLSTPSLLVAKESKPRVFAEPSPPHTATLQRMAVKYQFQGCGLGTVLINRAMVWANDHDIHTVNAVTNELQGTAAQFLQKHGFRKVKKVSSGWFGQYEAHWSCNVKTWMDAQQQQQQQ
ncbi:acyl-CoA N-acyltransferase [Zychaea mexicana]|uniref:acyl-CoA N-acyltransferase n=1 Tax=Zychaea mexicana TaxID=64656 RepID=UPI0022FE058B|nr:acyl-CoA N-acyltransferase [Zychaea mexicana]KAI9499442.1 acyl-CoA N-acyltransferase [Zychaea mexicana]